jgi:hypothetical protein
MANDHYAVCGESKEYAYLGEFYCWDEGFRADESDPGFLTSQLGFAAKLFSLMRRTPGKIVEVLHENDFADRRMRADETLDNWVEI